MIRSSGMVLAQPRLGRPGVGVDDEDRVARPHLGLRIAAERAREALAHRRPVHARIRRVEGDLARARRRRVAVDRDARAVGPAVAHLAEHRPQVLTQALLDCRGLAEQPDDPAHSALSVLCGSFTSRDPDGFGMRSNRRSRRR